MIAQLQERRKMHRAFLLGKSSTLRPPVDRDAAVAQARRALSHLSDVDAHALIAEQALADNDDDNIARACVVLLSTLAVLIRRLQSPLRAALFIEQVYQEMRLLMRVNAADAAVQSSQVMVDENEQRWLH